MIKLKLAPALYLDPHGLTFPEYKLSEELYESESQAKYELGDSFLKYLADTPYEVEIEVDEEQYKELEKRYYKRMVK